jgi:RND family efflux transporter MFP subunit
MNDLGFSVPEPARITLPRAMALGLLLFAIAAAAFLSRWLPQKSARAALQAESRSSEGSRLGVRVTRPLTTSSIRSLVLPGSVQPLQETTLYPRASGYVRKWNVDIGDRVKSSEVLAEIDTPELDQQLKQARAQLEQLRASLVQARANSEYSKQTLTRYEKLTPEGLATEQDLDKQRAQAAVDSASITVAVANVDAQLANLERLMQLKSFARVTAPFDGIITTRSIDIGSLVTDGNSSPLFKVTATDPVRVFVQVPQDVATTLRRELTAAVTVREFPGRVFQGKVARMAGALDPATRTMNTEVRVPNPNSELLTGMYAQVAFNLPSPHAVFEIPATALLDDAKGLRVAIVSNDDTIHLVPVVIERDTGAALQIASGLDGTERIVRLMSADLTEGRKVAVEQ